VSGVWCQGLVSGRLGLVSGLASGVWVVRVWCLGVWVWSGVWVSGSSGSGVWASGSGVWSGVWVVRVWCLVSGSSESSVWASGSGVWASGSGLASGVWVVWVWCLVSGHLGRLGLVSGRLGLVSGLASGSSLTCEGKNPARGRVVRGSGT
jgi:hypothetical protein